MQEILNLKFDKDDWGEIINGKTTYKSIAKQIYNTDDDTAGCIIGWTDQGVDHRDILFTYKPRQFGNLQRGLRWCFLYISIMDFACMGFLIEMRTDNRKDPGYLKEKLRLHDNSCDDKICELINGVIHELDILEGNVEEEK